MKGLRTEYGQWVEPDEASTSSRSHSLRWFMLCHLKSKRLGAGSPMFIVCIFLFPRRGETSSVRFLCHIYEATEAIQMYIFMFDELETNYQISKNRMVLMTTGGIGISLIHSHCARRRGNESDSVNLECPLDRWCF
jgi:hypothetical protein